MEIQKILAQMGYCVDGMQSSVFKSEEDDADYAVWKVTIAGENYVLKEAKERELNIYQTFLRTSTPSAPHLYGVTRYQNKAYFLMEYAPGTDLRHCTRRKLTLALDALIALQDRYWETHEFDKADQSYENSLIGRTNRGKYLFDAKLEKAYAEYLHLYSTLPRTLCHDDLLPFNILICDERAVLIDWETGGMLPYPTPLARLLAHCEEDEYAFFHMTADDRNFAIDYYYDHLLKPKGISYRDYRKALDSFFLYEYCEWIMLGNKYGDTSSERYQRCCALARELADKINNKSA